MSKIQIKLICHTGLGVKLRYQDLMMAHSFQCFNVSIHWMESQSTSLINPVDGGEIVVLIKIQFSVF